MKLGIQLNAQHPQREDPAQHFAETVEQVRLIRELGFDSIWGGEHHITDDYHYFPLLPLMQSVSLPMPKASNLAQTSCSCPCTTRWRLPRSPRSSM